LRTDSFAEIADARLARSAAEDRFSGAVLVKVRGVPILSKGYGEADRDRRIANSKETQFRLGSMNKMFTATVALQLVQQSRLDLQTPVGAILTGYPEPATAAKVRIHHLLSHTSGLGNIWGPEFDAHRVNLRTCRDYVDLFGSRMPEFEPGSRYAYSNFGYILLRRILEVVSGVDYYELVRSKVFIPAGMLATESLPETADVPGRAIGYMRGPEGWCPNTETLPYRGTPAGGGYSTVGDLDRFATALMSNRLLDARHTGLLTTGKVDAGEGMRYGYGFMEETDRGLRRFGHTGGAPGMACLFFVYPDADWRVTILSNRDAPAAKIVMAFIVNQLFALLGQSPPAPTRS
jgi:D-alanyl-D-alanine carboxypeptidase